MSANRLMRMVNASTGKGRVSLVTGSASPVGLGRAMTRVFAREGAKVIVSDLKQREKEGLEAVKELDAIGGKGTAMWVPLDVTKEAEWKRAIGEIESNFGPLDVCCNNAGMSGTMRPTQTLDELDMDEFRKIVELNELSVMYGCKYAASSMKKNNAEEWKAIVNTSSIAGFTSEPGIPIGYTSTKFAVRGLSKAAAFYGAPLKIRVNSIHPGAISTDMTAGVGWVADPATNKLTEGAQAMANTLYIPRFGMPEEVANVVLLLAGVEGAYISGQSYVIDAGLWRG